MVEIAIPKLYIRPNDSLSTQIQCGAAASISDNMTATVSVTPIVTYDANNSFAYDISANKTYMVNFARSQPRGTETITDGSTSVTYNLPDNNSPYSRHWTNRKWKEELTKLIDRWQAQTDGNTIIFNTEGTGAAEHYNSINANVYIKQMAFKYDCGIPETLTGSMQLQLGSMYCKTSHNSPWGEESEGKGLRITAENQSISMSSSDGSTYYQLYFNSKSFDQTSLTGQYSCVESYEMKCGPMQPFPYVTLTISKKRLANVAPDLVDDICAGSNTLVINACGKQPFIVTKCKSSGSKYKIKAYALEEAYRGISPEHDTTFYSGSNVMDAIINLVTGYYPVGDYQMLHFDRENIKYAYTSQAQTWVTDVTFPSSYKIWQILNICAMRLGCQIYFMEDKMYIIDPSYDGSPDGSGWTTNLTANDYYQAESVTFLNTIDGETTSNAQKHFIESIVNTPSLGDEGSDSLINNVYVTYGNSGQKVSTYIASGSRIDKSQKMYNVHSTNIDLSKIVEQSDAQAIANKYAKRLCDTQQSISFELAERYKDKTWGAYFPAATYLITIIDHNSDTLLTNKASFDSSTIMPQKLMLSTITRHFPEFTSTYEFGVMAETDLTQTVSQILNSIG